LNHVLIINNTIHATKSYLSNYDGFHDELIAHTNHDHPKYIEDTVVIVDIIIGALRSTTRMKSLKTFQRSRNRLGALFALEAHNMINSKRDEVICLTEQAVLSIPWNGKNTRYPIDLNISSHHSSFNEITRAEDFISYEILNNYTRAQIILNIIQSSDLHVMSATTTILANNIKRNTSKKQLIFSYLYRPPPL